MRKTIGPDGGVITSHDGVLSISILPGALSKATNVEIFPSDEPPRIFGPAYRVRPDIELEIDAEVTYRRVLPADPEHAAVGAIRRDDYVDGEGQWTALPRLILDPANDSITATDDELSLYYGLLELDDAPPTGTDTGDPPSGSTEPPSQTDGSTTGSPGTSSSGIGDASTSTGEPPDPSTTTGDPTDSSSGSSSSDSGGSSSDDGTIVENCADGIPMIGELCYVAGGEFDVGAAPADLALGDFDGDTNLDVVTVNRTGGDVSIVLGAGDGTFGVAMAFAVGASPSAIDIGDFDDDGELDVIVANTDDDTVGLLLGAGDGTFAAQDTFLVGDAPTDLQTASYDAGTADDLVVVSSGDATLRILTGAADGVLTPSLPSVVNADAATAVTAGEFNSDGPIDAFTVGAGGGYHGWAGNGAGSFMADTSGVFNGTLVRVVAGDIDLSGTADLAVVDASDDTVQIQSGNGGAAFGLVAELAVGADPSDVALGDLTGSGPLDLAVTGRASNDVTIIRHIGGGMFSPGIAVPVGTAPSGVKIGEVTGDGVLDIIVCNEGSDSITVVASDP